MAVTEGMTAAIPAKAMEVVMEDTEDMKVATPARSSWITCGPMKMESR